MSHFNIVIIGQAGRLEFEATLMIASLRRHSPNFQGRIFVAEPQPNDLWSTNPGIPDGPVREYIKGHGAQILPFENRVFGEAYPNANKIECLSALPPHKPFLFLDTDTFILDELTRVPFDFDRPSASVNVSDTWPKPTLYGPEHAEIWASLYRMFDLDFASSLDMSRPETDWRRYLYFNAGFFYYKCPHEFGRRYQEMAQAIHNHPPRELAGQAMFPWLDQIALPLVIHSFGGGRDALPAGMMDGNVTCHYRYLPLMFAREPQDRIDKLTTLAADPDLRSVLETYPPFARMLYQGDGELARALYTPNAAVFHEKPIRQALKKRDLWYR